YQAGAHVTFSNTAITIDSTTFINAGEIDVVIHVSSTGAGTSDITITNPDHGSGTCAACFTINAAPLITSSTPSMAANTGPVTLTLTGSGFASTGTAKLTTPGQTNIVGTNWTRNTATSLSIDFDITNAAPGAWVINIVNGDGGPGGVWDCFRVTA